ncbi:MAG: hypothetical protein EON58_01920 [Alphaproteobacteria bacterium]|nr:MAG: hypothetical protein EON58_01920 [Alphaproteobacteria bacterium]
MPTEPTPMDDYIYGTEGAEVLRGLAGNDTISGYHGADQIYGDEGNDTLQLGGHSAYAGVTPVFAMTMFADGGIGNDTIDIYTNASNATALGGDGDDTVRLRGVGGVTAAGGIGNDTFDVERVGTAALTLGAGNDIVNLSVNTDFAPGSSVTITDYVQGQDRLSLNLNGWLINWNGSNPFTDGYLRLVQSGADTLLQMDRDAAGTSHGFTTLVRFQNTQASSITDVDLYPVAGGSRLIYGTAGNDSLLYGTSNDDIMYALAGNDSVNGAAGADTIYGGDGDDYLGGGGGGNDRLYGEAGNDTLSSFLDNYRSSHDILMDGGAGDDYLFFGSSTLTNGDTYGPSGTVMAGIGNDIAVLWGTGPATVNMGTGNDTIQLGGTYNSGVPQAHTITLGAGADTLIFVDDNSNAVHVVTDFNPNEDVVRFSEPTLFMRGGSSGIGAVEVTNAFRDGYLRLVASGSDTILQVDADGSAVNVSTWVSILRFQGIAPSAFTEIGGYRVDGSGTVNVTLSPASTYTYTPGWAFVNVGQRGGAGHDTITGIAVGDLIYGEGGNDTLRGFGGNDTLYTGFGDNLVEGGEGNDTIYGQGSHDRLFGGEGNDAIIYAPVTPYGSTTDTVLLDGGEGDDQLSSVATLATVTFSGGAGNDIINVDGFGQVAVDGGAGNDRVTMSNRTTTMTLGVGGDVVTMRYFDGATARDQRAVITDFQPGVDQFLLARSEWMTGYTGGNPFALGYLWLLQDGADVVLRRDYNGGGDAYYEMVRFQNINISAFTAADFEGFNPFVAPMIAPTQGSANRDLLFGSTLDNVINGLAGDDLIWGYAGNDAINGGEGYDIAVFSGGRSQYIITNQSDGSTRVIGPDGTDTLTSVERIRFTDGGDYIRGSGAVTYTPTNLSIASFGSSAAAGGWADNRTTPRIMADVNGDGRDDIVGFGSAGTYVSLANGSGGFGAIFLAVNSFGSSPAGGGWSNESVYPRTMADVNGDGREDIVGFGGAGTYVSLANANGTFGAIYLAAATFGSDAAAGGWTNSTTYPRMLADINGDGRADLVGFGSAGVYAALGNGIGGFGAVYLALNSFGASAMGGGWNNNDIYTRTMGDVNGDGRADIVGFGGAGTYVALATGNGNFGAIALVSASFGTSATAGGWASQDRFPRMLADMNGDGRDDIVGFGNAGTYVSYSDAAPGQPLHFGAIQLAYAGFGANADVGSWTSQYGAPRMLADINGDGLADIVGFGPGGTYVATAGGGSDWVLL